MYVKICECCGKRFPHKSINRKYCSIECAREKRLQRQMEKDQICIYCKNACGGCNWSKYLKPVFGWIATPIMVKDKEGEIRSYDIIKCPEFIKG